MSSRFDLGQFLAAGRDALVAYVVAHPDLPAVDSGAVLDWPPLPVANSDIARLRAAFARVAFEMIRSRLTPTEAAVRFVQVATQAFEAGEHATKAAIATAGYGDATGRQRVKALQVLAIIADCLERGVTSEADLMAETGVSRRTLYRYMAMYRESAKTGV